MNKKLEQMTLAKEKTGEMLKEKEEALRLKEEELQTRGQEQEKLQMEIKKLGKIKEFKSTMADLQRADLIANQRARDDALWLWRTLNYKILLSWDQEREKEKPGKL